MFYKYKKEKIFIKNNFDNAFINASVKDDYVFIELVKVQEEYRRNSYAKKLLQQSLLFFKSKGYRKIRLNAIPLDSKSMNLDDLKSFYRNIGFKDVLSYDRSMPNLMELNI